VGNLWETTRQLNAGEAESSSLQQLTVCPGWSAVWFSRPNSNRHAAVVLGQAVEKIPESARYEHDKKREKTVGNPSSGHKNPE
jgi:hypothetical protein